MPFRCTHTRIRTFLYNFSLAYRAYYRTTQAMRFIPSARYQPLVHSCDTVHILFLIPLRGY